MTAEQQEFYRLVQECLDDWNGMIGRAYTKLGALFNPEDYPSADAVAEKYAFNMKYLPVPEVGDFRVDVGAEALAYLNESYSSYYAEKINSAYSDVWARLHEALGNMSTRLDGHTRQIFRDTLVSNVTEIVDLLGKFNVTGDPKLQAAERKIRFALLGVTPESLREDDEFRLETKGKVDALLKEFAW
jgi:hypothetical protein